MVRPAAFALAVATAALVGLSAPVASAASFSGPSGFNGDSVLNVSGNQIPVQACNDTVPVNVLGGQVVGQDIAGALGILTTGTTSATTNNTCTNNPTETNGSTISSTN